MRQIGLIFTNWVMGIVCVCVCVCARARALRESKEALLLFGHTCSIWKFLGQGSNLSHSCSSAGSLTHCATEGTPRSFYD